MTTDTSRTEKIPIKRDWTHAALVVVDVQNDFCPGGKLAVPKGDEVVAPINELIREARKNNAMVLFTQDAHPEETEHFKKWPPHCIVGDIGYDFHKDLDTGYANPNDEFFEKGTGTEDDGYSAFDGSNAEGTGFKEYLQLNDITKLYIVGLATDYCVRATALDGVVNGFDCTVILPATRAVNLQPLDEFEAVVEMDNFGVEIEP